MELEKLTGKLVEGFWNELSKNLKKYEKETAWRDLQRNLIGSKKELVKRL